jgi:hypothetical protein
MAVNDIMKGVFNMWSANCDFKRFLISSGPNSETIIHLKNKAAREKANLVIITSEFHSVKYERRVLQLSVVVKLPGGGEKKYLDAEYEYVAIPQVTFFADCFECNEEALRPKFNAR